MKARIMYMIALSIVLSNCGQSQKVGGDRDEHGCIGSAGYQWSELKQECIRPFETGVTLVPVEESTMTIGAYLVFNNDSSKAEAFTAEFDHNPILERSGEVWASSTPDNIKAFKDDKGWVIEIDGEVRFREK